MTDPYLFAIAGLCALVALLIIALIFVSRRPATDELAHQLILQSRQDVQMQIGQLREELQSLQNQSNQTLVNAVARMGEQQTQSLADIDKRILQISQNNEKRLDAVNQSLAHGLANLQTSNEKKLDQMRQVVDEKLHATLEKRLGESFRQVSQHLEAVQRGLGEMQSLANGVGDLKRVLTNVKSRGTWGEVQLEALLDDVMTPEQFDKNVATRPNSQQRVEFALRLPGHGDAPVWLPIDAKFPQEDYLRLQTAIEEADVAAVNKARASLLKSIREFAKDITSKYVEPPHTTDFAIMFLPTEGLYAEILRSPGVVESLQRDYRIVIAGPVTLTAILNSLRIGFKTLAIEQRTSEVWQVLAGVKSEFGKFADILEKVKKQLNTASSTLEQTGVRTRAMERRLHQVETLSEPESDQLFSVNDVTE
ncbi:Uncharacterised protein [BD1-7 clade bacterium]|uniref:DNA recombination protein RmuC n=1 Tax=BD1-7 clade bacterium TaxID=2029982 RepID=A0A5S9P817_9GAMM|nr:Uncharacterised protein [BD1-7 clade bacterium]